MTGTYAAVDLGAESGRIMLATLADGKISLEEIHRFPTPMVRLNGHLRWNIIELISSIKIGLAKLKDNPPSSIAIDSWGVDCVLIKGDEPLLTLPFCYRDDRLDGAMDRAFARVRSERIFGETGIQFMQFNTIFQLHEDVRTRPEIIKTADGMLMIADYLAWLLCGRRAEELTLASTSQLYNPVKKRWSEELISELGIPRQLFQEIVPAGAKLGPLTEDAAKELGLPRDTQVVATCAHDTAAAVAAVPATGDDWAYLSSGTWSLLGVELSQPIINEQSRKLNFTNEVGFGGTIRFLKNIIGLWLVQECRRTWLSEGRELSYEQMTKEAAAAPSLRSLVDPDDPRFLKPGEMPKKIADFCRETNQPVPNTVGETVRCALESLAMVYRKRLRELEQVSGRKIARLHIVGGGSRNELLNQLTANATGIPVIAGPAEGTAIGNALVQAVAMGQLKDLNEIRAVVRNSFELKRFDPVDTAKWDQRAE